jgi:predicted nucleic acid-binding protein
MMKHDISALVFDSSSLISITDSCFIHALQMLRRKFPGKFIIPPSVEFECVAHPRKVKMHALHALRIARAINEGVIEVVSATDEKEVRKVLECANSSFSVNGRRLELLHRGEAEALVLARQVGCRDIVIDERTTRLLAEDPKGYAAHLRDEFGGGFEISQRSLDEFLGLVSGMRFYRSVEIIILAYENGYFDDYGAMREEALEASLYRLKYTGCAISEEEISQGMACVPKR